MNTRHVTLYHASPSRSSGVLTLLEALGADYELKRIDLKAGDNLRADFLALNPMGKVPTLVHDGVPVTEQVAVYQYLAELYPEAGLAPAPGDALRGPFLRWLAFYGSCFEPAMVDKALKRETAPRGMSPYVDADTVLDVLEQQLAPGPWLLGERQSAADFLWGSALGWMSQFGLLQPGPATTAYIARMAAHPAVLRSQQIDAGKSEVGTNR